MLLRSRLWLLNATCFTLLLTATLTASSLLDTLFTWPLSRYLLNRCLRCLRYLLWRTSTASAIITHLELLALRVIGRVVYAHPLREVRME